MRLDLSTWKEVEAYLESSTGIIIPVGSTEQHGPMGLIGTDALCAEAVAHRAADAAGALVAPTLSLTPARFNMAFPGTLSVSADLFEELVSEVCDGLILQGFRHLYFLNGHGANLAPLRRVAAETGHIRIRSWWDFDDVNAMRSSLYGDWEGMHATPSEIAITQALYRVIEPGEASEPPRKLSRDYIMAHAGDRHGPPDEHRRDFPDGRVGSHSALATPEAGRQLLEAAVEGAAEDYRSFLSDTPGSDI